MGRFDTIDAALNLSEVEREVHKPATDVLDAINVELAVEMLNHDVDPIDFVSCVMEDSSSMVTPKLLMLIVFRKASLIHIQANFGNT